MARKCWLQPVHPKKNCTYPFIARRAAAASASVRACASSEWKRSQRPHGYPRASGVAPRQAAHAMAPAGLPSGRRGGGVERTTCSHASGDRLSLARAADRSLSMLARLAGPGSSAARAASQASSADRRSEAGGPNSILTSSRWIPYATADAMSAMGTGRCCISMGGSKRAVPAAWSEAAGGRPAHSLADAAANLAPVRGDTGGDDSSGSGRRPGLPAEAAANAARAVLRMSSRSVSLEKQPLPHALSGTPVGPKPRPYRRMAG
mmetsp:Transcript_24884/g.80392  ORF Transcript_24884/g.80392 Transcript_24884/m.80392 type:complete len:263 (-) Transcript_24884:337-1125(-)